MKPYRVKVRKLPGTNYLEIYRKARALYKIICSHSKRRPYIRSAYFKKSKIFLGLFWAHLDQKNWRDRSRRLRLLPCAIDLIRNSLSDPISITNPNRRNEMLYRFIGKTPDNEIFMVQIKEDKASDQKWLISVFPE